jgi:type II secretory pathway pseudopilin PulG
VSITTTDSKGNVITTIPSSFTSTGLTTSGGNVFTVTRVVHNPSGALDSGSSSGGSSSFFNNKGAVAGVFVVVGLAVVAILAALGFIFFRKRRRQRLDREVTAAAVAASAAAARSPLDEEGDIASSHPTSESYPSTMSAPMQQYNNYATTYGNGGGYDPFALQSDGGAHATGVATAAAAGAGAGAYGAYATTDFSDGRYHDAPERYHDDGPFHDAHEYVSDGQHRGYDGMEQGGQGYYYDPYYDDDPNAPHAQGYPQHNYNEDMYGAYSGGVESIGTPTHERTDPLHVANPSNPPPPRQ